MDEGGEGDFAADDAEMAAPHDAPVTAISMVNAWEVPPGRVSSRHDSVLGFALNLTKLAKEIDTLENVKHAGNIVTLRAMLFVVGTTHTRRSKLCRVLVLLQLVLTQDERATVTTLFNTSSRVSAGQLQRGRLGLSVARRSSSLAF